MLFLCIGCAEQVDNTEAEPEIDQSNQTGELCEINEQIKLTSNDPQLYYNKALIYFENKDLDNALADIDRALYLDSSNNTYLSFKSDVLYFKGDFETGRDFISQWLRLAPNNKEALIKLVKLHLLVGDHDSSLAVLGNMLKIDQFNPQVYFYQGMNYLGLVDTTKAIDAFQKSVALDQKNTKAHVHLGNLFAAKRNQVAIKYYNLAIKADSLCIDAFYGKAMYYQNKNEPEWAGKLYKQILRIEPNQVNTLFNLGYLNLIYFDSLKVGVSYFTSVLEINNNHVDALYNRGYCHELLRELKNAEADYRLVLSINPQYDLAAQGLSRLGH